MKNDKRFENKTTLWAFIAIFIMLAGTAIWNKCSAQMTIPLMEGTVESGDVYDYESEGGDPFTLTGSYFRASTTEVKILFKRRPYERMNTLTYAIDSIDICYGKNESELLTLWPKSLTNRITTGKIEIYSENKEYQMYIYNDESIFFFKGKVL
jgi:hypothetical protein